MVLPGGCSFHLPNETSLAKTIPELNVSGDYRHPFYKKVIYKLKTYGTDVRGEGCDMPAFESKTVPTLVIPSPQVTRPLVSVNTFMKANEYNIIVHSATTLHIPGHRPLLMRNSLTRTILKKTGEALASSNESNILINETYDELASQLLQRLGYLGRLSDPDHPETSPAELLSAKDEPESNEGISTPRPSGTTLMDALRAQSVTQTEPQTISLDELNNGTRILDAAGTETAVPQTPATPRTYKLPKVEPKFKHDAPDYVSEEGF